MEKYFPNNPDVQLIHVTSSYNNLVSILKESSFRLKYCKEEFATPEKEISRRVHPMVCFTEQNVNYLSTQNITYGMYGIAMTPDWVVRNNIQPLLYIEEKSNVANALAKLLLHRKKLMKGHPLRLPIMTIACFTKNAVGRNSYLNQDDFLFKNENEWRYVPCKNDIGNYYISESRSTFNKNPEKYNERLKSYPLKFEIKNIIMIYCNTKDECEKIKLEFPHLKYIVTLAPWNA